jgi:Putative mono-oxygenase ydhR
MITTIVQFSLPKPISLEEAARAFESTAPKYQGLRGLVRKYYLRSEDGCRAGGVYLWETRAAAEAVYNGEWKARVKQLYGSEPEISWFDTPVIVDNQGGGAITIGGVAQHARLTRFYMFQYATPPPIGVNADVQLLPRMRVIGTNRRNANR